MGRLRDDREAELFCNIAAEVTDLFGTDDGVLYRFSAAEDTNLAGEDPLWDEPTTVATFQGFELPLNWFDFSTTFNPDPAGGDGETDALAHLTVVHLKAAGVNLDHTKDYVAPGDILEIHSKCGHESSIYDILQTNRVGWINSSDKFTGYELTLKRTDKYVPERKNLVI